MSEKTQNRWLVVVGALLIQMSLGAIYIYSVFKPALKEQFPDWSATNLALPSQLVLAMFALGVIVFGRIQDKIGPRKIATLGGVLLGAGLAVAKFSTSLPLFVLGFSVIGGIGIGAAYVCPIATCVKWFPDKRGLITGLAVAGFGAGGLVFTPVAKTLIASQGIMNTFLFLGLIFLVLVVAGAQFMVNPPSGYKPAGWNPPAPQPGVAAAAHADYTWQQMLGTPQFWMLWLTYFAGCTAGLMIIMNTTNVWQSFSLLGMNVGDAAVGKSAYATLISQGATAVIVVSIFNAIGRIAWGKVSDSIGRRPTLLMMFGIAGVAMLVLNLLRVYPAYMAGLAVVGFCFGGFLALYPAVTADYFGTKNVGANYGWVFSAYGVGGLFGPWLAPKLMEVVQKISYETVDKTGQIVIKTYDAGNYFNAFVISGVLCFVALGILALVKPPKKA